MGCRVEMIDREGESIGVFTFLRVPMVGEFVLLTSVPYVVAEVEHLPYGGMVVAQDVGARITVDHFEEPF